MGIKTPNNNIIANRVVLEKMENAESKRIYLCNLTIKKHKITLDVVQS